MTTKILSKWGRPISSGHNLAVINHNARKRQGVTHIDIAALPDSDLWEAVVTVGFMDGCRAVTQFASIEVAKQWANKKRTRRGTFWTGCIVRVSTDTLERSERHVE